MLYTNNIKSIIINYSMNILAILSLSQQHKNLKFINQEFNKLKKNMN